MQRDVDVGGPRLAIQTLLGPTIVPRDIHIYCEALVHKSAAAQFGYSQERLEHLGDAVLGLCVTHMLFTKFPDQDEGALSRMRTSVVCGATLAVIGRAMEVQKYVIVGNSRVHAHDKFYEDTFEALVGAVYLDLGLPGAMSFVAHHVQSNLDTASLLCDTNQREALARYLSNTGTGAASYDTIQTTDGLFECSVRVNGQIVGSAQGPARRKTEMEAARVALESVAATDGMV